MKSSRQKGPMFQFYDFAFLNEIGRIQCCPSNKLLKKFYVMRKSSSRMDLKIAPLVCLYIWSTEKGVYVPLHPILCNVIFISSLNKSDNEGIILVKRDSDMFENAIQNQW